MAAPPIDFLNSFFWQFTTIAVALVAVIGFLVYRYYLEPPISRMFTSARWSKGPVGFVQDDANQVHLVTSQAALPEGIIYTKRGFFLQGRMPYIGSKQKQVNVNPEALKAMVMSKYPEMPEQEVNAIVADMVAKAGVNAVKRGRGRPRKIEGENSEDCEEVVEDGLSEVQSEVLTTALQCPTLAGFGRAVFFGYDGAPLVSNLKTLTLATNNALLQKEENLDNGGRRVRTLWRYLGHADLRVMKEIIPATISRTQLGNLYKWAVAKGYEKKGGDQMKLLYIAIAAAIPIACLGIVAFLLINGGGK